MTKIVFGEQLDQNISQTLFQTVLIGSIFYECGKHIHFCPMICVSNQWQNDVITANLETFLSYRRNCLSLSFTDEVF